MTRSVFYIDVCKTEKDDENLAASLYLPLVEPDPVLHLPSSSNYCPIFEESGLFRTKLHHELRHLPDLFFAINNLYDPQEVTFKTLGQLIMGMMTYETDGILNFSPILAR